MAAKIPFPALEKSTFFPSKIQCWVQFEGCTLQGTNISPKNDKTWHFEDDFPFPKMGYVNSLEGILHMS